MSGDWKPYASNKYKGKVYWFNKNTGQTSWERPVLSSDVDTTDPTKAIERYFSYITKSDSSLSYLLTKISSLSPTAFSPKLLRKGQKPAI
jgi:outer membrane protein assembly factor BamB